MTDSLQIDSKSGNIRQMNKKQLLETINSLPDNIDFSDIVEELTNQPGVSQTTLASFIVGSSKSAIGRIKAGQEPTFLTGVGLLRMYATLCPDNNDEKGKDNA